MSNPPPQGIPSSGEPPFQREAGFWGTGLFVGRYGLEQTPLFEQLDPEWATGIEIITHVLAASLAIYFSAGVVRRIRSWLCGLNFDMTINVRKTKKGESE